MRCRLFTAIVLAVAGFTLAACGGPTTADKEFWSDLAVEDQRSLCDSFWQDEGYRNDEDLWVDALVQFAGADESDARSLLRMVKNYC